MPDDPNNPNPQQTVDDLDKAQKTVEAAAAAGGLPTEITLADGQKFVASSPQELIQRLADAKAQANAHIAQIQRENAEMRQQLQGIKETQDRLRTALSPDQAQTQTFDKLKYYQLFQSDPMEAYKYARSFDPEYIALKERQEQMQLEQLGRLILSLHPELSGKQQDISKVLDFSEKLGGFTADHINASIAYLQNTKQIAVGRPAPTGPTPPPVIPGAGAAVIPVQTDLDLAAKIESAPDLATARALMEQAVAQAQQVR